MRSLVSRGIPVRGASRNPRKAEQEYGHFQFVEFDYDRPDTFDAALADVSHVFMIVRPGDEHSDRTGVPFVRAMTNQGVKHVVLLSAMGAESREDLALRKIELAIESSGMSYTHLRPNWFMQVFSSGALMTAIREMDSIEIPAGSAKISFIDARDIAEAAEEALVNPIHQRRAYTLTGGEALSYDEVAKILSRATGKNIRYVDLDEQMARDRLKKAGFPPEWVERLIGFYQLVREGFCSPISNAISLVLKRQPRTFSDFARDNAACWKKSEVEEVID